MRAALLALLAAGCGAPLDVDAGYEVLMCGYIEVGPSPAFVAAGECVQVIVTGPAGARVTPLDVDSACEVAEAGSDCIATAWGWRGWVLADDAGQPINWRATHEALDADGTCPLECR